VNSRISSCSCPADENAAESGAIVPQTSPFFGEFRILLRFDLAIEGIIRFPDRPGMAAIGEQRSTRGARALKIRSVRGAAVETVLRPGGGTGGFFDLAADVTKLAKERRFGF
jgi:hypothetical protein